MEPREGRQSDAQGRPSRRAELVALLVAVIAAAIVISLLFQVPFLQPILATPLAFADLLAIVSERAASSRSAWSIAAVQTKELHRWSRPVSRRIPVVRLPGRARASPISR